MDSGLPILNCFLQHTLRNLCTSTSDSSTTSSRWVYSIFWRILPRNYPTPKWEHGASVLDRAKGNKRNWILVWEDGFCDFFACQRAGGKRIFGADIFFKMSHEVYNYGEGLIGKVAAENSHRWIFSDNANGNWTASLEPQPKAWEAHFNSGIQTIAIISVREGIVQLGSFDKVDEDIELVINTQRKFSHLQSLQGINPLQRPSLPIHIQYPHTLSPNKIIDPNQTVSGTDCDKRQHVGSKRHYYDRLDDFTAKSIRLGYNSPHNVRSGPSAAAGWSIPPLFPWTPSYPLTISPKWPPLSPSCNQSQRVDNVLLSKRISEDTGFSVQVKELNGLSEFGSEDLKLNASSCTLEAAQGDGSVGQIVEMESRLDELGCKGDDAFDLN